MKLAFTYDKRNRLNSTTDVFGHLLEYEYEHTPTANQRRLKLDGAMYAAYNFDDAGRLSNLVNSADGSMISFGYDNEDKLTSRIYPNGVTTNYEYFKNDNLKRLTDVGPFLETLFDRQYTYNSANQIETITEPTNTRTFAYDLIDRLKTVTASNGQNESYTYDDVGNRTASHRSPTYGYQPFNRLISTQTQSYSYDANGNRTTGGLSWDFENRLTGTTWNGSQSISNQYDALGRRVSSSIVSASGGVTTTNTTNFIHDGQDVVMDENTVNEGGGEPTPTITKYLNGPGIDNKLRVQTGSDTKYFLADHLGSTNGLTDSSGVLTSQTAYDSFGNQTGSLATRYGFTGRERDDFTGLMYYRARFYDANLGRFISEDPIGFRGGDVNLYGYVWNNPSGFTDPSGLNPVIRIGRKIIKDGLPYIFGIGKEATMKQAQNMRKSGKELIVEGADSQRVAKQIEQGAFPDQKPIRHDPHGDNDMFLPHYQTKNKPGHTFYRGAAGLLAPNILETSENPCATNGQLASAMAWDTTGLLDPIGLTDAIDSYTGLDGGRGGLQGLGDFAVDAATILIPVPTGAIKRLY